MMEHHKDRGDAEMRRCLCEPAAIVSNFSNRKKVRFILIAFIAFQTGLIVQRVGRMTLSKPKD